MTGARSNGAIKRQTSVEEKLFAESNFLRILGVVRRYGCPRRLNRNAYLAQRLGRSQRTSHGDRAYWFVSFVDSCATDRTRVAATPQSSSKPAAPNRSGMRNRISSPASARTSTPGLWMSHHRR
jgi:hypothetical protein